MENRGRSSAGRDTQRIPNGAPVFAKPIRHSVDIQLRLQGETLAQVQNPCQESFFGVKKQGVQRLLRLAAGRHREFTVRKLEQSIDLETRSPAQQIFGGNSAGMNVAGCGEGNQPARGKLLRLTHRFGTPNMKSFQYDEVTVPKVRPAVSDALFPFKRSLSIEEPVRINQKITSLGLRFWRVKCLEHLKLKTILEECIEHFYSNNHFAGSGAVNKFRRGAEPFEDFCFLRRSRGSRQRWAEILLDRHCCGVVLSPNR